MALQIQIINRTTKTEGEIKLRFRLRDGRNVDLYHKSEIKANLKDLSRLKPNGAPKDGKQKYNAELRKKIRDRISILEEVYESHKEDTPLTNEIFEILIDRVLNPDNYMEDDSDKPLTLLDRFQKYLDNNTFAEVRTREYNLVLRTLERFFKVKGLEDVMIEDFDADMICDFQEFITNEYQYAAKKKYAYIYNDMSEHRVPRQVRKQNTTQSMLKMVKAFYQTLEDSDEVPVSPFRKLGKKKRADMLREEYNAPVALTLGEVQKIINTDVPAKLQCVKDAFLLQVALGCRISDYISMNMDFVKVSDGIPYVAYVAKKTGLRTDTPLPKFAFEIVKRTNLNFPTLKYASGKSGYNKLIKELIQYCGIDREVEVGKEGSKVLYSPIAEVVSSKTARKTNVTLCADAQIDKAVMGLHEHGSKAIANYDAESLMRKFKIISFAFRQPLYMVDEDLNIIE